MLFLKKNETKDLLLTKEPENNNFDGQVQVAVDQLNGIVEQVKIATMELEQTSSSSKESTDKLLAHSETTVDYTLRVSDKMRAIESSALNISASSQEILSNSQASNDDLSVSWNSLQDLQKKFEELSKSHNTLLMQMNQLVSFSEKIHDIVHTIGAISQKTKILALNASIEAARAGEHGKGFSVVANEVGKLASQTSAAVEETRENIDLIREEIKLSTKMVEKETEEVEAGTTELGNVLKYLESFKVKLSHITDMVSDSTHAVDEQTESVQEIANLLEQISQLSIKNKENVIKVNEDMDRQHQSVQQIVLISDSLTSTSNELQGLIRKDESINNLVDYTVIEKMQNDLSSILHSPELLSMNDFIHKKILDKALVTYEELEAIWSNRVDGTFVYSNPTAGLVNAKARPWFTQAFTGKSYVSEPYISALTKKACITLSFPIYDDQAQIIGVLGADLSIG